VNGKKRRRCWKGKGDEGRAREGRKRRRDGKGGTPKGCLTPLRVSNPEKIP